MHSVLLGLGSALAWGASDFHPSSLEAVGAALALVGIGLAG